MRYQRVLLLAYILVIFGGIIPAASAQTALTLPDLTGTYSVSRTSYDLTDPTRDETFTLAPNDKREIRVTVYYPATPAADAQFAPYVTPALQQAITKQDGIPYFLLNIGTHTYANQPAAPGKFPLLIFSPGFGGIADFYTSLLEEVASHGYIVAALAHPYSLQMVEFSDGRMAMGNDLESQLSEQNRETTAAIWAEDAEFALNTLENLNLNDPILASHLDLDHIGAFGHSFGGATAAELTHDDTRVAAAINMDGTMFGDVAQSGLTKPFMMMQSSGTGDANLTDAQLAAMGTTREKYDQATADYNNSVKAAIQNAHPGYDFVLGGSEHNNFTTDFLAVAKQYGSLLPAGMLGTLDPDRAFTLIRTYVVAFFDQQLKGDDSGFLEHPPSDPDVTLTVSNPSQS